MFEIAVGGIAGGVNARTAVERVDAEAGIVCQAGQAAHQTQRVGFDFSVFFKSFSGFFNVTQPQFLGRLHFNMQRGKQSFYFRNFAVIVAGNDQFG